MKHCVTLAFILIALSLAAQQRVPVYNPSLYSSHLRCEARKGAAISFRYGTADTTAYNFVELRDGGDDLHDDFPGRLVQLRFGSASNGVEKQDSVVKLRFETVGSGQEAGLSLKMMPRKNYLKIIAGGDEEEYETSVPLPADADAWITAHNNSRAKTLFCHNVVLDAAGSRLDEGDTSRQECEYSGEWRHYEQASSPLNASSGAKYVLGVGATAGALELFIIRNEGTAGDTEPGTLKGTLTKTGIEGVYDLVWYDAAGNRLYGDNTAVFSGDVLTLTFPRWSTSVRYVKQK